MVGKQQDLNSVILLTFIKIPQYTGSGQEKNNKKSR
jgi:hypothetical protein